MDSSNPFSILAEQDEPKIAAAPKKQPAKTQAASVPGAAAPSKSSAAQNGKQAGKPQKSSAAPVDKKFEGSDQPIANGHHEHRPHHGPRRGQKGWHGRGRTFDRHSAMPKDSERKANAGWGTGEAPTDAEGVTETEITPTGAEGENVEVAPEVQEEPDAPVKTLEEYLAEKAAAKSNITRQVRKVDGSQYTDVVRIKKDEEDEALFPGVATASKEDGNKKKKDPKKTILEIDAQFQQVRVSGRGRGGRGRGGDRGRGRGRGESRGGSRGGRGAGRGNARIPDVKDVNSFPVLA